MRTAIITNSRMVKPNTLARQPSRPLLLRPLREGRRSRRNRCRPAQSADAGRNRRLSRRRRRFSRRHGRSVLAERRRDRRALSEFLELALRCRDVAGSRDPRGGARGRDRRGHPLGGAADRRRVVRGERPSRARRGRGHHRGLLLRVDRRPRARRPLRHQAPARMAPAGCAASCARASRICKAAASWSPPPRRCATPVLSDIAFYNYGHLRRQQSGLDCRCARGLWRLIVEFQDKVVAITGAAGGIGRELCRYFGGAGRGDRRARPQRGGDRVRRAAPQPTASRPNRPSSISATRTPSQPRSRSSPPASGPSTS